MWTGKTFSFIGIVIFVALLCYQTGNTSPLPPRSFPETTIAIPLAGNGYITQMALGGSAEITKNGLRKWADMSSVISIFFRTGKTGVLHIGFKAKAISGNSTVKISVNETDFSVNLAGSENKSWFAGTVAISKPGYIKVDLQGISKTGTCFADVSDLLIGGSATTGDIVFANDPENFYWSRRGPSCHLNYTIPHGDKEYFYSELTVPEGEDKMSTYFMANGFGEGYMGIQVNSPTERRVLFSVWDADSGKTTLVRKGEHVIAQGFGGEGTGGQSYLVFNWKAGTTYRFLTHGKPDGAGNTIYTSWFFAPEAGNWKLIASWKRPNTHTYLTRFHGFLENFNPDEGYQERKAYWSNQWVRLADGTWTEVTAFTFTVDATGKNKQRRDYAGGVENGKFFLRMDGFFNENVSPGTGFSKPATGQQPVIDLEALP